jgi:glutathione S-transferase
MRLSFGFVRLLLSLLGLGCERVTIDSSPWALRGNGPRGPVLEDDARVIGAAAVLRHIASGSAPSWLPASPGPGDSWLSSLTSPRFAPGQARLLALFTADGPPPELVEEAAYRLQDMDDHLTLAELDGRLWFAGDRPTIVDVAAFGPAGLSNDYGVEHDAFPAVRRWIGRFRALPGFLPMPGIPAVLLKGGALQQAAMNCPFCARVRRAAAPSLAAISPSTCPNTAAAPSRLPSPQRCPKGPLSTTAEDGERPEPAKDRAGAVKDPRDRGGRVKMAISMAATAALDPEVVAQLLLRRGADPCKR